MEFTEKSIDEVGEWLKLKKFSRTPCKFSRVFIPHQLLLGILYTYLRFKNKIGCSLQSLSLQSLSLLGSDLKME